MKNIQKTSTGKYTIIKIKYQHVINYGTYKTLKKAIKQAIILEENNWIKNKQTGYSKKEEFPAYTIRKTDKKYYIQNRQHPYKKYGPYDNYKYTRLIKKILPYHEKHPDIKQAEYQAQKEYYKYIYYEQQTKTYKININNKTIQRHKTLKHALIERDIALIAENDEETRCNIIPPKYNEKLPPTPWKKKTPNITTKTTKNTKKYIIQKQIQGKNHKIGTIKDKQQAIKLKEKLEQKNWDREEIKKIRKKLKKPNRNIKKLENKYYIYHKNNKYYTSNNLYKTRYVRDQLEKNNWNKKEIKKYQKKYNKDNKYNKTYKEITTKR